MLHEIWIPTNLVTISCPQIRRAVLGTCHPLPNWLVHPGTQWFHIRNYKNFKNFLATPRRHMLVFNFLL